MIEINFKNVVKLAVPISIGMLGLMLMGVVDLIVAGRLGAWATSTVSVTNAMFSLILVVGIGAVGGTEVLASQAVGAGRKQDLEAIWVNAAWISFCYGALLTAAGFVLAPLLMHASPDPETQAHVVPVFRWFIAGLWPCLIANICRQLLQSQGVTVPGMLVLLSSNIVNILANLVLVLGLWFPDFGLGVVGTGVATLLSRIFMAGGMLVVLLRHNPRLFKGNLTPDRRLVRALLALGIPGSLMMGLEVGVFAAVGVMASTLGPIASAAHQSVLNIASMTYMVPLGIASATTVLVGQSYGRKNWGDVARAGRYGVVLSLGFMVCTAALMLFGPRTVLSLYSQDENVLGVAATLLWIGGAFQVYDGLQATLGGALRGLGDVKPLLFGNLIGHWGVGFPLAVWLTFFSGWFAPGREIVGAWIALTLGLVVVSAIFSVRWRQAMRRHKPLST